MNHSGNGGAPGISAFFPAFNDAENMRSQIPRMFATLQSLSQDFEIIVVNDGSSDDTASVLESLTHDYPSLRVVTHYKNQGYGAALQSGFRNASKELIFYTDGDGQYDVSELRNLLAEMSPEVGMVMGFKIARADATHRSWLGNLYHHLVNFLFGLRVKDVDCDFRLVRRSVMESVQLTSKTGAICVDLMRQVERAGNRVVEVPVHHYPRLHGKSQFFRIGPVALTLLDLGRLWFRLVLFHRRKNKA